MSDEVVITIRANNLNTEEVVGRVRQSFKSLGSEIDGQTIKTQASTRTFKGFLEGALGPMPGAAGLAVRALGSLGIAFGATQVISFARGLTTAADDLVKLHDKTDLTYQGLQRLQIAGDDAGNTVEELAAAINQFQNRLASGDSSAVAALGKLHLNLAELRRLSPEEQFYAISDAIRQVQDPAEQVAIATDLFGKKGMEVLPTLKRGFDDLKDASVGMSDAAIATLSRLADTIDYVSRLTKGWAGELLSIAATTAGGLLPEAAGLVQSRLEMIALAESTKKLADNLVDVQKQANDARAFKAFIPSAAEQKAIEAALDQPRLALVASTAAAKKAAAEAEKAAAAHQRFADSARNLTSSAIGARGALTEIGILLPGVTSRGQALDNVLRDLNEDGTLVARTFEGWAPKLQNVGHEAGSLQKELEKVRASSGGLKDTWGSLKSGNFGDVFKDVGGFLKTGVGKIGTGILEGFGNMLSGGITSLINGGISLIGKGIGKLFGSDEKKINPLRQTFIDAAGGLDELNKKAAAAGVTLDTLLDAKNPKQYEAAIKQVNAALEANEARAKTLGAQVQDALKGIGTLAGHLPERFGPALQKLAEMGGISKDILSGLFEDQKVDVEQMRDLAQKYGVDLASLGPAFQSARISEGAARILDDFTLLTGKGADVGGVLFGMREEIGALVIDAKKFGTVIPENMRPLIDELSRSGNLLDANGEKIVGLDKLSFGDPIKVGMDAIIDRLDRLLDGIGVKLPLAIKNIPDGDFVIHGKVEAPDMTNLPGFAAGGVVTSSTLARIAEGGQPEIVGSVDFMTRALSAAIDRLGGTVGDGRQSGGAPIVVQVTLDGRVIDQRTVRTTQRAFATGLIQVPTRALTGTARG